MNKDLFFQLLKLFWKSKKRKIFPNTSWIYPHGIERQYLSWLVKKMKTLTAVTRQYAKPNLSIWVKQQYKNDAEVADLREALKRAYEENFKDKELEEAIRGYGEELNKQNKKQWEKYSLLAVGFAFTGEEQWLNLALTEWTAMNTEILKNLGAEYIQKVNLLISQAVQQGLTYRAVMGQLEVLGLNYSEKKLKMIAVDQIGTLNGLITKFRQLDVGIEQYTWNTQRDERVRGNPSGKYPKARPSHWAMQGKICKWLDNSVYSNDGITWLPRTNDMPLVSVGMAFLCRCTGLPRIQELLNRAGESENS